MTDPLGRRAFRRRLRRLSPGAFRAFVAALYAGHEDVTVVGPDGPVGGRDGGADDGRTLYAHHPRDAVAPAADAVVSPTETGPGAGPAYLFDLARHGTGAAGDEACRTYLGAPPADEGPAAPDGGRSVGPWQAEDEAVGWSRERVGAVLASLFVPPRRSVGTAVTVGVVVVLVAAVAAGLGTVLVDDREAAVDAGAGGGTGTDGGDAGGDEPTAATTTGEATAGRTVPESVGERYAALRPTCDRPPGTVLQIQLGAFRHNDPETDAGIRAAFAFAAPGVQDNFDSVAEFADLIRGPTFDALLDQAETRLGPPAFENGTATWAVTVVTGDGSEYEYRWELTRQPDGSREGCWLTTSVTLRRIDAVPDDDPTTDTSTSASTSAAGGAERVHTDHS